MPDLRAVPLRKGPNQIARILTREQILNPTNQYYQAMGKACNHLDTTRPYNWCGKTVANILENIVYLGHTLSMKQTTLSYKNKKQIRRPESEADPGEEHPCAAGIAGTLGDRSGDVRHKRRPPKHMEEPNLFSGLAYCSDCRKYLVLCRTEKMREDQYYFRCSTYGKRGKDACTPHQIRETDLKADRAGRSAQGDPFRPDEGAAVCGVHQPEEHDGTAAGDQPRAEGAGRHAPQEWRTEHPVQAALRGQCAGAGDQRAVGCSPRLNAEQKSWSSPSQRRRSSWKG